METDRKIERLTDGLKDRWTLRQKERLIDGRTNSQKDWHLNKETNGQTNKMDTEINNTCRI